MTYLCADCCLKRRIRFIGDAVNEAGRKFCSECGTSLPWKLHILGNGEHLTQQELDDIPQCGGYGAIETTGRDGKHYRIPVLNPMFVLYSKEDEICYVTDNGGNVWFIGYHEDTRYKMRVL